MGKIFIGNIRGPKGDKGDRGSNWKEGTTITGTSTTDTAFPNSGIANAMVDDQYLNTDTGNLYTCTVAGDPTIAKWIYTGNIKGPKGDVEDGVVEFSESNNRENIASGDTVSTVFGKIKKWFTDLGTAAFMNVVNNVTQSEAGQAVLDAAVGKYLEEKKFDISKIIANRNITEPGFVMDGKTVADALTELNGNIGKIYYKNFGSFTSTYASVDEVINHLMDMIGTEILEDSIVIGKFSLGGAFNLIMQATTNLYAEAILYGYVTENISYFRRFNGTTTRFFLIKNSDLGYVNCEVNTIANESVVIPGAPNDARRIPIIIGHSSINNCLENISYINEWRIYSTVAQTTYIRFFKYPI